MRPGHCHVGTSGWNYKHWANGRFYPPRLSQRKWLAFYATHYDTVEVNNSFYRIPSEASARSWCETVPPGFVFAMKIWRGITHYRKLTACEDLLERFFAFAGAMPPGCRGPLLLQLPPNMARNDTRLDSFLDALDAVGGSPRWKVAVEFRNPSWLTPETYRMLDRHDAAVSLADMDRCLITEPNHASFVYIRRHGAGGRYHGRYAPEHIAADAARIQQWLDGGRTVYVYYNNDIGGHAVDNATQLKELLGIETPSSAQPAAPGLFD